MLSLIAFVSASAIPAGESVFGVAVDQPLNLPECTLEKPIPGISSVDASYEIIQHTTCRAEIRTDSETGKATASVKFSFEHLPPITKHGTMDVMISDGRAVGFKFWTYGISSQDEVLSQLTAKYGKAASLSKSTVQNLNGASFDDVTAIWLSHGLTVTFISSLDRLDNGLVTIDTPEGAAIRKAAAAKRASAATAL